MDTCHERNAGIRTAAMTEFTGFLGVGKITLLNHFLRCQAKG